MHTSSTMMHHSSGWLGSVVRGSTWIMTQGFFLSNVCVPVLYSSPWQVLCSPHQPPSRPAVNWEPLTTCCKTSVFVCAGVTSTEIPREQINDKRCDSSRLTSSFPLTAVGVASASEDLHVWRFAWCPCRPSTPTPQRHRSPKESWLARTCLCHGADKLRRVVPPTEPWGDGAVEKPPWPRRHSLWQRAVSLKRPRATGANSH